MGYFYIKVLEARKVAIRTSFFVNYPFIRLVMNEKDKKDTNFKPGVEWWDKILMFKLWKETSANYTLRVQARDKSIHVFGSDWLGEVNLNVQQFLDGEIHQKWFKLGKGVRNHTRAPRGYVHLAFQYRQEIADATERPFAGIPVEKVMTFEEWLVAENEECETQFMRVTEQKRASTRELRASSNTSDAPHLRGSSEDGSGRISPPSHESSDTSDRRIHAVESSDSVGSSDGEPPVADLIDFSFDTTPSRFGMGTLLSHSTPSAPSSSSVSPDMQPLSSSTQSQSSSARSLWDSQDNKKYSNPFSHPMVSKSGSAWAESMPTISPL